MGDLIPKVRYNPAHLAAHAGDFLFPIEELHARIKEELAKISVDSRTGEYRTVLFPGEQLGWAGCIADPNPSKVFWGYRNGRKVPSRLVINGEERHKNRGLTIVGRWQRPDLFILYTMYPGRGSPQEITDPGVKDEAAEAIAFWQSHALIARGEETVHPKSEELESALARGDSKEILKLSQSH